MYALYKKTSGQGITHYQFVEEVSLFGRIRGYIPSLLQLNMPPDQNEPYAWHLNIGESLSKKGREGHALIINLKPRNVTANLSLYEIINVWGYSCDGWTPILMHLRGLLVDEDPNTFDGQNFDRADHEIDDPIFSMMYLRGTVRNGRLENRWTTPGASPTNSVLLWPEILEYFMEKAKEVMRTAI